MKKINYIVVLCLLYYSSFAQIGDTIEVQRTQENKISFAKFIPSPSRNILSSASFLKTCLNTNSGEDFLEINSIMDDIGYTHKLFQQYYQGIKIDGAVYATHGKNGIIETINGNHVVQKFIKLL